MIANAVVLDDFIGQLVEPTFNSDSDAIAFIVLEY